ncbi:MAG: hypothetical protein SPJ08_04605, partial [Sphaerochaetaceae bacterium]|nr:hypothetical protein [Sphaerochaetaceae bacterium]
CSVKVPFDVDITARLKRIKKDIDKNNALLSEAEKKLSSQDFINKASENAVQKERNKREEAEETLKKLNESYEILLSWEK